MELRTYKVYIDGVFRTTIKERSQAHVEMLIGIHYGPDVNFRITCLDDYYVF